MAKHANPVPERHRYWVPSKSGTRLLFTPFWTPARESQARLGIALANRAAAIAAWVVKSHDTAYAGRVETFAQLAQRTVEALQGWKADPEAK